METSKENLIDPTAVPKHIAAIMDGNGRWARNRGLPRLEGHRQGYKALKNVLTAAADLNVKVLTAYAFSSENWKRPEDEVSGLMKLITYAAKIELKEMMRQGVRIICSGRFNELPQMLQDQLNEDIQETAKNDRITLNLAINYGGRNEIIDAAKSAARMVAEGKIQPDEIDEKLMSSLMYHPELPDPDLLLRTAGELRLSNFLTWQTVYTEIFITQATWPEVDKDVLIDAILAYQNRTRKFGGLVDKK